MTSFTSSTTKEKSGEKGLILEAKNGTIKLSLKEQSDIILGAQNSIFLGLKCSIKCGAIGEVFAGAKVTFNALFRVKISRAIITKKNERNLKVSNLSLRSCISRIEATTQAAESHTLAAGVLRNDVQTVENGVNLDNIRGVLSSSRQELSDTAQHLHGRSSSVCESWNQLFSQFETTAAETQCTAAGLNEQYGDSRQTAQDETLNAGSLQSTAAGTSALQGNTLFL